MEKSVIRDALATPGPLSLPLWDRTEAAVLIVITERDGEPQLLMTRRTASLASHQGEVSFPGGHREASDPTSLAAAVREAGEEVGVPAGGLEHLGTLDDVFSITGFRVTPHVAWLEGPFEPRPDPGEVAEVIWAPLATLVRQRRGPGFTVSHRGMTGSFPVFRTGGHMIWGLTARILQQLLAALVPPEERSPAERLDEVFRAAASRLLAARRVILATHVNPDADGLGSQLALARFLRRLGAEVRIANADPVPRRFRFLYEPEAPPEPADRKDLSLQGWADTLVVVDTGEYRRLGRVAELAAAMSGRRVVLDHHLRGDIGSAGDVVVADPVFSSTGEMVHRLLSAMSVPLDPALATPLYAALQFDTRGFRFIQGRPEPLLAAAALVAAGAEEARVQEGLFATMTRGEVLARSRILAALRFEHGGRFAWALVPASLEEETGADREEIGEAITEIIALEEVRVAALVREERDGRFKVSLRSKACCPVGAVAQALGGGGHLHACGATAPGPLEDLLARLITLVGDAPGLRCP
ncbi:MAG: NUDIX domain-containing protein [Deltaproteobacteria bacterium]|nr:NUDIX domain-containing protein [Deltaproteobacteria bacterium]